MRQKRKVRAELMKPGGMTEQKEAAQHLAGLKDEQRSSPLSAGCSTPFLEQPVGLSLEERSVQMCVGECWQRFRLDYEIRPVADGRLSRKSTAPSSSARAGRLSRNRERPRDFRHYADVPHSRPICRWEPTRIMGHFGLFNVTVLSFISMKLMGLSLLSDSYSWVWAETKWCGIHSSNDWTR